MAGLGVPELLIILVILLLVFGPKRLPGLGRQLGGGMREFKDSITGKASDDDDDEAEEQAEAPAPAALPAATSPPAEAPQTPPAEPVAGAAERDPGGAQPPPRA
jgi:sec-independent protein translocase protein TatA